MKKILTLVGVMILTIIIGTRVQAESGHSFNASFNANNKTVSPGEEVTITFSLSDLNMGENGANTVEGVLKYNKDIFEEVKKDNIQSKGSWNTTYNDENTSLNGKFLSVIMGGGVKTNTEVFSVRMKVKQDVASTTTQVTISGITSNDGTDLITAQSVTETIAINGIDNATDNGVDNGTDTNEESDTVTKKDATTANKKIPKTGEPLWVIPLIGGVIVVAGILWVIKKKMKEIK